MKKNTSRFDLQLLIRNLNFLLLFIFSNTAFASDGININSSNGLAMHGYDPVAYFVSSKATEGKPEFIHKHNGNSWSFSSDANKQSFIKDPDAFIPQYGGHCAFAASQNAIANTDPYAWTIHNNKLYLNYSKGVRSMWLGDRDSLIKAADGYWPELSKKVASRND